MTHTPCDPTVPLWPTAQELPTDRELERLSEVFKIFNRYTYSAHHLGADQPELCVADLAEQLGMSQSAVSTSCGCCATPTWSRPAGRARASFTAWMTTMWSRS